jgi:hypothetical protein
MHELCNVLIKTRHVYLYMTSVSSYVLTRYRVNDPEFLHVFSHDTELTTLDFFMCSDTIQS